MTRFKEITNYLIFLNSMAALTDLMIILMANYVLDNYCLQGTSDLQLERINVYYNEATGGKYVPR